MGILYIPIEKKIIGPWLLGSKELEELDTIIEFIDSKLKESQNVEFKTEAEKSVNKGHFKTVEEAQERLKYRFDKEKEKNIVLISSDDTQLMDKSLRSILVDTKIKTFKPVELDISIEYGYSNIFNLKLVRKYDGELRYNVKCFDNNIENEINYKIEKWVEKNQPNWIKRIWNEYSIFFLIFSATILLFSLSNIYTVETPSAISIYKPEIEKLLKEGINQNNQFKATELLLKVNTNYIPKNVQPVEKVSKTFIDISILAFILVLIFWQKPRTTIGIGKHKKLITIYNWYMKIVLISIPTIFILPPIIEFIKNFFNI